MEDLDKILGYYPKLKKIIDKDKPKIYNNISNTQYVKNEKINPNIGLIYDFGGADYPVRGKNVVIVDEYNPNAKIPSIITKNYYDRDLRIYKLDTKDKNLELPETLEVNGELSISYTNILNFPKYLKVKKLSISFCNLNNNIFNYKLVIENDLHLISNYYNGGDLLDIFISEKDRQNLRRTNSAEYQEILTKMIKDKIIQNGGQVGGNIKFQ
jgi:hypothetical protein